MNASQISNFSQYVMLTSVACLLGVVPSLFFVQGLTKSLDFIIDTSSGDHPFDPYMSLLKNSGVLALVGFPSEIKLSPASLNIGKFVYQLQLHIAEHVVCL